MPRKKIVVSGIYRRGNKLRIDIILKNLTRKFVTVGEWTEAEAVRWSEQRAIINQQIRFDRFRWQDWFTPKQWGEEPTGADIGPSSSFKDCVNALEGEMASSKPQSLDMFRYRVRRWAALDARRVASLKPTELRQVFNKAGGSSLAPNTQRSVISACSKVLALAKENGAFAGCMENYYALTEKLSEMSPSRGRGDPKKKLTIDQVDALLSAIGGNFDAVYEDWFETLFFSGMRPSEARALEWTDIDFVNGVIDVNKAKHAHYDVQRPKTASSIRRIRMLPRARVALTRRWQAEGCPMTGLVFKHPSSGGFIEYQHTSSGKRTRDTSSTAWYKGLELAGLPRVAPYATRHTYATALHNAGLEGRLTARQLGHTNTTVLHEVYAEFLDLPGDIEAIDAAASRMMGRAKLRAISAEKE